MCFARLRRSAPASSLGFRSGRTAPTSASSAPTSSTSTTSPSTERASHRWALDWTASSTGHRLWHTNPTHSGRPSDEGPQSPGWLPWTTGLRGHPHRSRTAGPARTHLQVSLRETCWTSRRRCAVKFTVTPLGGGRADAARVVDAIVRYLQPPPKVTPSGPSPASGGDGPARYYADRGEEPGRWLGRAAPDAGLAGVVQPPALPAVPAGRGTPTAQRPNPHQRPRGRTHPPR